MPYTSVKDDNMSCVHKKNPDGSLGERIACHDSESGAIAQIAALESEERRQERSLLLEKQGHTKVRTIREDQDGNLVIPVIGIPFTGVVDGSRDLAKDMFDESTDIGPLKEVYSYFDHGHAEEGIEAELKSLGMSGEDISRFKKDYGFGRQLIGTAVKDDVTAEGIWYNIIVNRRHRYKNLLRKLAEDGYLDASSAVRFREDDGNGKLKTWHVVSVDLTPHPMNPNAVSAANYASILKSVFMEEEVSTVGKDTTLEPEGTEEQPQEEPISKTPLTDSLVVLFDKARNPDAGEEQPADGNELLKAIFDTLKSIEAKIDGFDDQVEEIDGKIIDLQTAFPVLANEVVKSLTSVAEGYVEMSEPERSAKRRVEQQYAARLQQKSNGKSPVPGRLPDNAPGKH